MADNNTIARPYATAVFEIAQEAGELAEWSASLEAAGAVERFARRLNRSRGIRSATRIDDRSVGVVTNRFGFDDLETVEALVERVWKQTMATQPRTAATS